MRFSMLRYGVFAVLVALSPLPLARAQSADGKGDRREGDQKASGQPVQFFYSVNDSAKEPPKADQTQTADPAQGNRQANADYLKALGQADESALKSIGAWVTANQGSNAHGQTAPSAHWVQNKDGLAWFSFQTDRSSTGIDLVPVDDAIRSHLKLPKDQGLLVTRIDPHSPAAQAGLQQNDVLLKLGDSPLSTPLHLDAALKAAGDKPIVLHFYRDGIARDIHVQPQIAVSFGPAHVPPPMPQFWIGVSVGDVEPALRAQLRLPTNKGLLVNEVFKGSPAEKAGVKVNDILLSLDGKPLTEQKTLIDLVQANGGKTVALELLHEGKPRGDLEVTPERRKAPPVAVGSAADPTKLPQTFQWSVVRPGAVLNLTQPYQVQVQDIENLYTSLDIKSKEQQPKDSNAAISKQLDDLASLLQSASKEKQSKEPNAALAKRLDEMHAEIEKLLKLMEEVNGALKANEDLKQAIELLKKQAAEKK